MKKARIILIILILFFFTGAVLNAYFFKITYNSYKYLQRQTPDVILKKVREIVNVCECEVCKPCESWTDLVATSTEN